MINPANTRPNLSSIILGILGREFNQERQKGRVLGIQVDTMGTVLENPVDNKGRLLEIPVDTKGTVLENPGDNKGRGIRGK